MKLQKMNNQQQITNDPQTNVDIPYSDMSGCINPNSSSSLSALSPIIGECEGLFNGDAVGSDDGSSVGCAVGIFVGSIVGSDVGYNVGTSVGLFVGE